MNYSVGLLQRTYVNNSKGSDGQPIESRMLTNAITNAQKQIEGKNFDIRKNLKDYDDVLAKQRDIIYKRRDAILMADDIVDMVRDFFHQTGQFLAKQSVDKNSGLEIVNGEALKRIVEPQFLPAGSIDANAYDGAQIDEAGEDIGDILYARYLEKRKTWPAEEADRIERQIALHVIDRNWQGHIDTMSHLRDGISLRSYAQTNPLQDYVNEGYDLFAEMNTKAAVDTALNLLNVRLVKKAPEQPAPTPVEQPKPAVEQKPAEQPASQPETAPATPTPQPVTQAAPATQQAPQPAQEQPLPRPTYHPEPLQEPTPDMDPDARLRLAESNLRRADRAVIGNDAYARVIQEYNDAVAAKEEADKNKKSE